MKPYKLMPAAEEDLESLVEYVARDGPQNAIKVLNKFEAAARKLAEMPGLGNARPDVTDRPLRFWAVYSWLIVYRPGRNPLEIIRILHGSRDLPNVIGHDGD